MQPSDGEPDQPNEPLVVDLQEPRMEGELVDGTFAGIEEGLENLTGGDRFVIEILRQLEDKNFVSGEEVKAALRSEGQTFTDGNWRTVTNLTSRGVGERKWIGENADERGSQIRKTNYKTPHNDNVERIGFCKVAFDEKLFSNKDYFDTTFIFSQQEWEGTRETPEKVMRKPPERITDIFWKKVTFSDFKAMYGIRQVAGGSSDTFIDIPRGLWLMGLHQFAKDGEIINYGRNWEPGYPQYKLNAYVLGDHSGESFPIHIHPKWSTTGNHRYRLLVSGGYGGVHRAWGPENSFPEPPKDAGSGEYHPEDHTDFDEDVIQDSIKNLKIYIIRTTYRRYFASYINQENKPESWPDGLGLEKMFEEDEKYGIIKL